MMMMDICTDGNVQDMEMEKLKEKYFKGLLEQLKINEKHQVDQDSFTEFGIRDNVPNTDGIRNIFFFGIRDIVLDI